jgi:glyoxylase-like metal-dependent hydrolase (beta-lactamase superfamily II)
MKFLQLALLLPATAACNPKLLIMKTAVGEIADYQRHPGKTTEADLEQLAPDVYTYRWRYYRNLIVDTRAGLVVVDPLNPAAGADLAARLAQKFPGKRVHTLIYSHYHLDHAEGGAPLKPRVVIAHSNCPRYWQDIDARHVLPATRLVSGDQVLNIGGVEIRLFDLGLSHTDTFFAVYLPRQGIMFGSDMALIHAFPPNGMADTYYPGYLRGMKRLAGMDFRIYVGGHFGYGTKADFLESVRFFDRLQKINRDVREKYIHPDRRPTPADYEAMFEEVYLAIEKDYGDWHGFDQMVLPQIIRFQFGEALGY